MGSQKLAVTVDYLVGIAREGSPEVQELSYRGSVSLIRRFIDFFRLSIREGIGTSGFRKDQTTEAQVEERDAFIRRIKQIIVERQIPVNYVFNIDQTGILYENPPTRTIDFIGSREVPIGTQGGEKKRLTLFSLFNAAGNLLPQMVVMKGVLDGRVHAEIRQYDDETTIHYCQENAWCNQLVLQEWHEKIWRPIAESRSGSKLLIVDSYPLHTAAVVLLSQFNTYVLFVPTGLTFPLQP